MALAHALSEGGQSLELCRRQEDHMNTFANKKQEVPQGADQKIQVGIDAVRNASKQTSYTINKMTDQFVRKIAIEIEQQKTKK
jgi:hypothetical protein